MQSCCFANLIYCLFAALVAVTIVIAYGSLLTNQGGALTLDICSVKQYEYKTDCNLNRWKASQTKLNTFMCKINLD